MKVKVNSDACIGCGACEAICPDYFELNDEGISVAKESDVKDDIKDQVMNAMDTCPTGAIEEVDE